DLRADGRRQAVRGPHGAAMPWRLLPERDPEGPHTRPLLARVNRAAPGGRRPDPRYPDPQGRPRLRRAGLLALLHQRGRAPCLIAPPPEDVDEPIPSGRARRLALDRRRDQEVPEKFFELADAQTKWRRRRGPGRQWSMYFPTGGKSNQFEGGALTITP